MAEVQGLEEGEVLDFLDIVQVVDWILTQGQNLKIRQPLTLLNLRYIIIGQT